MNPIPLGTGVRVLEGGTIISSATTGIYNADNYYFDTMAVPGTEVNSQVWDGVAWVENVPAVTIIKASAEPTPLIDEYTSDYSIQGRTVQVLPRIVEEVKQL